MVPYSWSVAYQIQATLQSSAKTPQQTVVSLYFWLRNNVAQRKIRISFLGYIMEIPQMS